jgi:bifunctional non-homologous end joining protein LigD
MPRVAHAIAALPVDDIVLDGEATWRNDAGYHVFDIAWLNGRDLTHLPLDDRRALLDSLALEAPLARVREVTGEAPWERACAEGWEGVIAKRRDSRYEHRRSKHWLKMKCELNRDFIIGGFTDPRGSRVGLGALLVGHFDGADFIFAGKVGTGLDTATLLELRARLDSIEIDGPPFTRGKGLPRSGAHWVRPEAVVTIAFIEWTVHGKLRHPRILSIPPSTAARVAASDPSAGDSRRIRNTPTPDRRTPPDNCSGTA